LACSKCPSAKRHQIAAKGKSASPQSNLSHEHPQSKPAAPTASTSTTSDEPEVLVDELDGILQLPQDSDKGKELHDTAVAQKSGLAATQKMKIEFGVIPTEEQLREAQDPFPKVE
jgi:hypothetical protein